MIFLRKKRLRSTRNLRREKSQRKPKRMLLTSFITDLRLTTRIRALRHQSS